MKLDVSVLRYLEKDDFRVLSAIEQLMRNHEWVPTQLISRIARLKPTATLRSIQVLHKNKLVVHDSKVYDAYRLTYLGYDFLALKAMLQHGVLCSIGTKIGVGKESDIYVVSGYDRPESSSSSLSHQNRDRYNNVLDLDEEIDRKGSGREMSSFHDDAADDGHITGDFNRKADDGPLEEMILVLKLHRLGRVSFKRVVEKRDYLGYRKHASWMYMSRLAALKEFAFMKALYEVGFPCPRPIFVSRHCVLMEKARGYQLARITKIGSGNFSVDEGGGSFRGISKSSVSIGNLYARIMELLLQLASYGLVHCDYNEFNLMVDDEFLVTVIDFPQTISITHPNAAEFFDRDVMSVVTFFSRKHNFQPSFWPSFAEDVAPILRSTSASKSGSSSVSSSSSTTLSSNVETRSTPSSSSSSHPAFKADIFQRVEQIGFRQSDDQELNSVFAELRITESMDTDGYDSPIGCDDDDGSDETSNNSKEEERTEGVEKDESDNDDDDNTDTDSEDSEGSNSNGLAGTSRDGEKKKSKSSSLSSVSSPSANGLEAGSKVVSENAMSRDAIAASVRKQLKKKTQKSHGGSVNSKFKRNVNRTRGRKNRDKQVSKEDYSDW